MEESSIYFFSEEEENHYAQLYGIIENTLKDYTYVNKLGVTVYAWYDESRDRVQSAFDSAGVNIQLENATLSQRLKGAHRFTCGMFPTNNRKMLYVTDENPSRGRTVPGDVPDALPIFLAMAYGQTRAQQAEYWTNIRDALASSPEILMHPDSKYIPPALWTAIHELLSIFEQLAAEQPKRNDTDKITEIARAEFFSLPISKIWNTQAIIASHGAEGQETNVGGRAKTKEVIIETTIKAKDGNPLQLTAIHQNVQRAIGNLIDENGGRTPIIVTPAQIYRAYARKSANETVTKTQAAMMEEAMDVLMFAPASVNFKAQIERHQNIKRQKDYDYSGELSGTLIQAVKLKEAVNRDGTKSNVAYKVYDVPMLYLYSHAINQIAKVPNYVITGGAKPTEKENDIEEAQGSAETVAMKVVIYNRVLQMKRKKRAKAKKGFSEIIRIDEIATDCNIALTDRSRRTLRKNIDLYLKELQGQKEIRKYSATKEGHQIAGFTVEI